MVLAAVLCVMLAASDSSDYKKAEELYAAGDFAAALELYTALGAYEDSMDKVLMCKYDMANAYFDSGDYKAALEIYTELGLYADAFEQAKICKREVGMSENADYKFLEDIEEAVNTRNKLADKNESAAIYLSAELTILEDYYNATFYDKDLKTLARKYIDGIKEQKDSLDEKYCDHQIEWYSGLVKRFQALCELHSEYQIFEDDVNFESIYVAQLDYWENFLDGLKAIDADLNKQLDGITFGHKSSYQMTAPYQNNTKYDFDVVFYFTFYDKNDVRVDESTEYFSNIKSGDKCTLEFWCPSKWRSCEFYWEINSIS